MSGIRKVTGLGDGHGTALRVFEVLGCWAANFPMAVGFDRLIHRFISRRLNVCKVCSRIGGMRRVHLRFCGVGLLCYDAMQRRYSRLSS
jgi:hypothetical protein